jgi:hypothetical protein
MITQATDMPGSMQAREKLNEAVYFLAGLRDSSQNPQEFNYNLSAFVSALHSVFDLMLFDFAEKYSMGITREDRITDDVFGFVAKALQNQNALNFLNCWRTNLNQLNQNSLFRKRSLILHRGYAPTEQVYAVNPSGTITGSTQPWTQPVPHTSNNTAALPTASPASRFEIYFPDIANQSALDACELLLNEVRRFVETIERNYWSQR